LSKVTLLVLKLLSETYILVFVINCSWNKVYFLYFWKTGLAHPTLVLT